MKIYDSKPENQTQADTTLEVVSNTPQDVDEAAATLAPIIDKDTNVDTFIDTTNNQEISEETLEETNLDKIAEDTPSSERDSYQGAPDAYDAEAQDEPQGPAFWPPSRQQVLTWLAFGAVVLLGAILRFWNLGDRPLHHDESLHAYFSMQLVNTISGWAACVNNPNGFCYRYDPLLHGPFQFHIIGLVYTISKWLGVVDNGVNTTTVRIAAATLGTGIVALPYFLRDRMGTLGAWLACALLAVSPGMVYFSRFAREDIYMAFFTVLLVIGVARYISTRRPRWLFIAALAFSLSYATKEATFLTIGVFGSFLGAAIIWEIGKRFPFRKRFASRFPRFERYMPENSSPVFTLLYFVILAPIAKVFFGIVNALSVYITDNKTKQIALAYETGLKDRTVALIPIIGLLVGIWVLIILVREIRSQDPEGDRRGLAKRVDPEKQPLLDTITMTPWYNWFFAGLAAWVIFLILFSVFFTNLHDGIGSGIWEGLYYWLQQIPEARGGQPWYYYLLLIPMYEVVGVVFGMVGLVRSLLRPTPFRLFLVYWFVGNAFIYSWAAEKMPWLMIHIAIPMLILAAVGLEPAVQLIINFGKSWLARPASTGTIEKAPAFTPAAHRPRVGVLAGAGLTILLAIALLIPTVYNMYEVNYVHSSDAPHEMMIYVQTTPYINTVMDKLDQLDKKYYGGKHAMPIAVDDAADWPFYWYLRDYTNVCYNFPTGCQRAANASEYAAIIVSNREDIGEDTIGLYQKQFGANYSQSHRYPMRWWWSEGYKTPRVCTNANANANCRESKTCCGNGPLLWLSYGDNPPPDAQFNPGRAFSNYWRWLWTRQPIGFGNDNELNVYTDMNLMIRNGLDVAP